jgi:hypothetical protein
MGRFGALLRHIILIPSQLVFALSPLCRLFSRETRPGVRSFQYVNTQYIIDMHREIPSNQ